MGLLWLDLFFPPCRPRETLMFQANNSEVIPIAVLPVAGGWLAGRAENYVICLTLHSYEGYEGRIPPTNISL
jgi:hypothetical protein